LANKAGAAAFHVVRAAATGRKMTGLTGLKLALLTLSQPNSLLLFLWQIREWAGRVALGLGAQFLSTLSTFAYVIILAPLIGAHSFGEYSVAWSFVALVDSLTASVFGDNIPALMHRLPERLWPEFRSALFIWSAVVSCALCIATLVVAVCAAGWAPEHTGLLLVCALAIPCTRAYQLQRRLGFVDGEQALALAGAIVYAFVLLSTLALIRSTEWRTAAAGLGCFAAANAASGSLMFMTRFRFAAPRPAILAWSGRHLWRSGRWFVLSSLGHWVASIGLIPLAAWLSSAEAGGALRILQNLTSPLYNATGAIAVVLQTYAARYLQTAKVRDIANLAVKLTALFVAISVMYSALLIVGGQRLFRAVFGEKGGVLTEGIIVIVSIAAVLECVCQAVSVPLVTSGHSKPFFVSRFASLVVLFAILPVGLQIGVLTGIAGATVASNLAAAVVLIYYLSRYLRSTRMRAGS
jgi:O-antigen/teichoic acid export membrane protein